MNKQHNNPYARVFFALWPKPAERNLMASLQKPLQLICGGNIMRSDTLHNTLVFIGSVEMHRLQALQLAAQEFNAESFELRFDEVRYWRRNRIVYAAPCVVPQPLATLVNALEERLDAHHFKFDRRDYSPHVTLLRNAHWKEELLPKIPPVCWRIADFVLVQSVPGEGLTNYHVLARFPLETCDW